MNLICGILCRIQDFLSFYCQKQDNRLPVLTQCPARLAWRVLTSVPAPPASILLLFILTSQFLELSVFLTSAPLLVWFLLYSYGDYSSGLWKGTIFLRKHGLLIPSRVKWALLEPGYFLCSNSFLVKPKHAALLQTTQVVVGLYF